MAQYKVPQDVEADDKLLGPFTFRQFIYLLIAAGLTALAVLFFRIFPLLAIIPVPPILLLLALALPLKKDQPMETYLAAKISYYLKPRKRFWMPGQRESVIEITAPKRVEESRTRDISGEEATHRLSFLADIVDSGGRAINNDVVAEANTITDMFENQRFDSLNMAIARDEKNHHEEVIKEMQAAIDKVETFQLPTQTPIISRHADGVKPIAPAPAKPAAAKPVAQAPRSPQPVVTKDKLELANNADFSVATIASEAKRLNRKDGSEVFISLH